MATTRNLKLVIVDDYKYSRRSVAAGALHFLRATLVNSNAAGDVVVADDVAAQSFAGVSVTELDQAVGGVAGDNELELIGAGSGKLVKLKFTGVSKANLGAEVSVLDNESVQLTADATNNVVVGIVREVLEANYCLVQI